MRIGSLVYATDQGLGVLAKSFYDAGVVTDVAVIAHGRHPNYHYWYPDSVVIPAGGPISRHSSKLEEFCGSMDVMLFFETPFHWPLIPYCRNHGIKTVIIPMYECMPARMPYQPDLFINPSHLDQVYYPQGIHIPVPVPRINWRMRYRARTFVHNSGHGGLKGRNGTRELIEAWHLVKSGARLIVRSQSGLSECPPAGNIEYRLGTAPYNTLYDEGDVFIFPEKFNGLSLPLQEARAAGMLVMCGDRFPMNEWLPREPLIRVDSYRERQRIGPPYNLFEEAVFKPKDIARTVDEWYDRDIADYSKSGLDWGTENCWDALKPRYMAALEGVYEE